MASEYGAHMEGPNLVLRPNTASSGLIITEGSSQDQQVMKSHNGYTGSEYHKQTAAISTTDNTATTILSIALPNDSAIAIRALIVGKKASTTDGCAINVLSGFVTNGASAVIMTGSLVTVVKTSAGAPTAACAVSGAVSPVLVQVTGIAAENWAWVATVEWEIVKTSA